MPAPEGKASTVSPASSDAEERQEEEVNDAPTDDDDDDDEGLQEDESNGASNDTVPQSSPSPTQNGLPDQLAIPDRLFLRCTRRFGWSNETCQRILAAYREFMELKRQHADWNATVLVPPTNDVDRMWHEHILDVQHYVKACNDYCGNLIGYNPDVVLNRAAHDSSCNCNNMITTSVGDCCQRNNPPTINNHNQAKLAENRLQSPLVIQLGKRLITRLGDPSR